MKFLAIDTGGRYLSVAAYFEGRMFQHFSPDCALQHSVRLMDEVENVLEEANMRPSDCDFFAAAVGPGSFTGIRIGISTVKGLCLASDKPALAVTSFDALAYTEPCPERGEAAPPARRLALIDAGHGCFYSCGYDEKNEIVLPPAFTDREETEARIREGFVPIASEPLFEGCRIVSPGSGLVRAALAKSNRTVPPSALKALYLRRSSAEENRK